MHKTGKLGRRGLPWAASMFVLALTVGCSQHPAAAVASPASAVNTQAQSAPAMHEEAIPAAGNVAAEASGLAALTEGMAYANLRATVLAEGWKPKVDPECRANVVGRNFAEVCKENPDQCKVCDAVPELSSCSGDGHCLMNFERGSGEVFSVATYGEIADWNVPGKASRLSVKWWDSESIQTPESK